MGATVRYLALLAVLLAAGVTCACASSSDDSSSNVSESKTVVASAPKSAESTAVSSVADPVELAFESTAMRDGESKQQQMIRAKFVEDFERFAADANVSVDQRQAVLRALLKVQEGFDAAKDQLAADPSLTAEELKADAARRMELLARLRKKLNADLQTDLAKVLTSEQTAVFWKNVRPTVFAATRPLI